MRLRLPLPTKVNKHKGSTASVVVLIVSVLIAGWLLLNRQYVIDQLNVWQYQPSNEVQAIATRAQMNEHGRFYFYASRPEVDQAEVFNQKCKKQEEHSAILGCYAGRQIYIYNVSDSRLDGVREVTAAHEMLHAAWDRLPASEKQRLTLLLAEAYNGQASDKLEERMSYYNRTQPGERSNELHSIIGTEFANLSTELEEYYAKYFSNRRQVVALHDRYESIFIQLNQKSQTLASELTSLAGNIEQQTARYNSDVSQLNNDINSFNTRAEGGAFSSETEFNQQRGVLIARSDALDGMRSSINANIARYNQLRTELEAVNSESEALNRSIDSSLAPAPAI